MSDLKATFQFFIVVAIFFINCMPVPMIQSPRIDSKFSITTTGVYSPTKFQEIANDADSIHRPNPFVYRPYDMRDFPHMFSALPEFHFGIARKLEISGYVLPPLGEYIMNVSLNTKIALLDTGSYHLFRNCAIALIGGGKTMFGEWEQVMFMNGGLIIGTRAPIASGELELIWIVNGFYNYISASSGAGITLKEKGLDNSIGFAYWPFGNRIVNMRAGVTIRTPFTRTIETYGNAGDIISDISPFIVQGGLGFDVVKFK